MYRHWSQDGESSFKFGWTTFSPTSCIALTHKHVHECSSQAITNITTLRASTLHLGGDSFCTLLLGALCCNFYGAMCVVHTVCRWLAVTLTLTLEVMYLYTIYTCVVPIAFTYLLSREYPCAVIRPTNHMASSSTVISLTESTWQVLPQGNNLITAWLQYCFQSLYLIGLLICDLAKAQSRGWLGDTNSQCFDNYSRIDLEILGEGGLQNICKVSAHTTSVAQIHNCLTWWQVAKAHDTICCPQDCPWQSEWDFYFQYFYFQYFRLHNVHFCMVMNHYLNIGGNLWCHRRI